MRGLRDQSQSIEFQFTNGKSKAFPYNQLGPMDYNPSAGLLLAFEASKIWLVLIEGLNLNALVNGSASLYDCGIQRHRVTWVKEMSRQQIAKAGEGEPAITRIRLLCYRPDDEPTDVAWLKPFLEQP